MQNKANQPKIVKPEVRLAAFSDWGIMKRNSTLESYEKNPPS